MDAGRLRGGDIGGLSVEQEVRERRPDERGTDRCHLLKFLCAEGHTVNQHQLADQEVVLHKDVKLASASFVHAFRYVDEPSVQFSAGVPGLDVVADIIRCQFCDLGVYLVSAEVVVFDVS